MSTITLCGVTYTVVFGSFKDDEINLLDPSNKYYNPAAEDPSNNFIIFGLSGDDLIVGSAGNNIIFSGSGNDTVLGIAFANGNNTTIFTDGGNDTVFSAVDNVLFNDLSDQESLFIPLVWGNATVFAGEGTNYVAGVNVFDETQANSGDVGFSFTAGTITYVGGSGADTLIGLAGTVLHHIENVDLLTIRTTFAEETYLYGGGGTDKLIGDFGLYESHYFNSGIDCIDNGGINQLFAGSGVNDVLIGNFETDIKDINNIEGLYACQTGANLLVGGDGGGDLLIGNVKSYNVTITDSPNVTVEATFGGNTLISGQDGGKMIGSIQHLNLIVDDSGGMDFTVFLGNTLIGGRGNDTMVGGVEFLNASANAHVTLANDTFQFALNKTIGSDVILDMNDGGVNDTLSFTGLNSNSVSAVDSKATFSDSGGDLLVSFNCGGSILFDGLAYAGQDSVLDITPHIVVI